MLNTLEDEGDDDEWHLPQEQQTKSCCNTQVPVEANHDEIEKHPEKHLKEIRHLNFSASSRTKMITY